MTSPEILAGDFLKSLLQNFPGEDNSIPEKSDLAQKELKTQNFMSNSAASQLKDLKNLLKISSTKELGPNDTINTILAYPKVLDINKLLENIFSILGVKSINDIFSNLIDTLNMIYSNENIKENFIDNNDFATKKIQFFDLIQELNFFISPSVIFLHNSYSNVTSKISYDIFINKILNDNKVSKNALESYINIFNIRYLVLDYFIWNKDAIIKGPIQVQKLLSLISILHLEKNYSYDIIISQKKNIFFDQENLIYDLYCTYNTSLKELVNLTDYLISLKKNWISIIVIEKIIYDKNLSEKLDNFVKKLMILHLIDYNIRNPSEKSDNSTQAKKEKKLNMKLISYYHILSDNKNIINFDFNNEVKELNNLFAIFVKNKDYDKCIKLLNCLDHKFISHIKKDIFHQMIKEFSFDKIERIKSALRVFPDEITYILNYYEKKGNFKDGIRLIKSLNLDWKEYNKVWDRYSIRIFYNYKIKECLEDKFDILLDYALISETLYNELINKLLNKLKNAKVEKSKLEKENINNNIGNNMNLKEIEFEFTDNNNNIKNNDSFLETQCIDDKNIFLDLDIINKNINDNTNDIIIEQEDSEE